MLNLPDLLASTAAVARLTAERAALPVAPVLRAEEDAVLERLPVVVREALEANPEALLAPWLQMRNAHDRALATLVTARLAEHGVEVREEIQAGRSERTPCALHVSIPSILLAASRIGGAETLAAFRVQWRLAEGASASADAVGDGLVVTDGAGITHVLAPGWADRSVPALLAESQPSLTAFRAAWQALAGPAASARINPDAGTLLVSTGLSEAAVILAPGWRGRAADALVEEARIVHALPRWSLAGVWAAWRDRAGHTATVTVEPSRYVAGVFRPVPCLRFEMGTAVAHIDTADVAEFAAVDVAVLAASLCGLPPPAPPPAPSGKRSLSARTSHP